MKRHLVALAIIGVTFLSPQAPAQDTASEDCSAACAAQHSRSAAEARASTIAATDCPVIGKKQVVKASASSCSHDSDCSACSGNAEGSCAAMGTDNITMGDAPTDAEDRVIAYLEDVRDSAKSGKIRLDQGAMEQALGFRPERAMLMDAVAVVFPDAMTGEGASRCSDYGACSLYGDLSSATGETLVMYQDEKGQDGRGFEDMRLPSFTSRTLDGQEVSSSELRGRPALVVPLAVHCSHSYDTLPILHEFAHEYGPKGLRVVGLLINSGSPEDATASLEGFAACHDFWVTEGDAVAKLMESRLVPSHFFVTAEGEVVKKFVGFKNAGELTADIESLLGA